MGLSDRLAREMAVEPLEMTHGALSRTGTVAINPKREMESDDAKIGLHSRHVLLPNRTRDLVSTSFSLWPDHAVAVSGLHLRYAVE